MPREGMGEIDRLTRLPASLVGLTKAQIALLQKQHARDLASFPPRCSAKTPLSWLTYKVYFSKFQVYHIPSRSR